MIISLDEAKLYLKVDFDDEDLLISNLIEASEMYLENATGKKFDENNKLAKLYCNCLIHEWYNNRSLMANKDVSDKVKYTLSSILLQLKY